MSSEITSNDSLEKEKLFDEISPNDTSEFSPLSPDAETDSSLILQSTPILGEEIQLIESSQEDNKISQENGDLIDDVDARDLDKLGVVNTQLIITEQYKTLKKNPFDTIIGWLTLPTFEFFTPMVIKGFLKPLQFQDIWSISKKDSSEVLYKRFEKWYKRFHKTKRPGLYALLIMFWFPFLIASIFKIWFDICNLITPLVLKYLLDYINRLDSNNNTPWWEGIIYIAIMVFLQFNSIFFTQQYFNIVLNIGMNIRSILSVSVYRKSLKLTTTARSQMTNGKITNLMSVDTQKVADTMQFLAMIYSGPFQIIFCLVALSILLKWPTIAGILVMILLIPFQMIIFRIYAKMRSQSLIFTDARIKSLNEVIQGIRVIKFFTYENEYLNRIFDIRKKEIYKIGMMNIARSFVGTLMSASPLLVSVSSFTIYALAFPNQLTPDIIFPSLSYFILLRFPMIILPMIITSLLDSNISMKRIDAFLKKDERTPIEIDSNGQDSDKYDIQFIDANFEWDISNIEEEKKKRNLLCCFPRKNKSNKSKDDSKDDKKNETNDNIDEVVEEVVEEEIVEKSFSKLNNINLKIKKGELIAIIGPVGSGKSSLLNGLVGEMRKTAGDIIISQNLSYAPQTPWIMNATVQDNILFYKPYNEEKLDKIIDVCALGPDIDIFENGILSVLGEQGINLSGGQKQRLNIARACYSDSKIIVLDDCLSAVDAHVSKHIFEKCILNYLKGKTRILVTHQIHLCERCDRIIVMDKGSIVEMGTYQELMNIENGCFRILSDKYLSSEKQKEKKEEEDKQEEKKDKKEVKQVKNFMKTDERKTGTISLSIFATYFNRMGGLYVVTFIALGFIFAQLGLVGSDWWLGEWSNNTFPNVTSNTYISLGIYAGIGVIATLITMIRDWSFFLAALRASYHLHNDALMRLLKAPTYFFDVTPVGAILSRMSKDVEQADTQLIVVLSSLFGTLFQVLASIAMVAYVTRGIYLALVVVILPFYIITQQVYRRTSRELKRLDSISRSPLYAHFSETLTGISTIRSYKKELQFQQVNADRMDLNQRPYFAQLMSQRWLAFRLESLGAILVSGASIIVLILTYFKLFPIGASRAGLAIVYSQTLTNVLSWFVRQLTEAETNFNAVERLVYYAKELPIERQTYNSENAPPNWPNGNIEFKDYEMRYRPELPLVLKGVNVTFKKNEKIGVVGRTGSGKSSLIMALFRMVEGAGGSIIIDNIDISKLSIRDIRRKISIIPQDPLLFSGTIRSNLDPFFTKKDIDLWDALQKASMKNVVEEMGGLDVKVNEGGENFSVGQRQLLCLARALLKKTNILILDEASASIDVESDAVLQKTIRETFSNNCTIITIAHRLLTIADYDKILVMDKGVKAEFDSPANLLRDPNSIFRSMVMQTGTSSARKLFELVFGDEAKEIFPQSI